MRKTTLKNLKKTQHFQGQCNCPECPLTFSQTFSYTVILQLSVVIVTYR